MKLWRERWKEEQREELVSIVLKTEVRQEKGNCRCVRKVDEGEKK